MLDTKTVFNAFFNALSTLETNSSIVQKVKKTDAETVSEDEYPCIEVVLGSDIRNEYTTTEYAHDLTIYTDIHIKSLDQSIDDLMLDVRSLIQTQILNNQTLGLDFVFRAIFIGQSDPSYNQDSADRASSTRLEFLIKYQVPHENK